MSAVENAKLTSAPNAEAIAAWDGPLFDRFVRFREVVTTGLSVHGERALSLYPPPEGQRVLDVGCGFGDSTQLIAKQIGPHGEAVGVDCAQRFVDAARGDACAHDVPNASFFVADVQTDDLRGPYDAVFSRFGMMFFNMPGAAMRNIRKALKPRAELTMIVWRIREDNPWVHDAELCVKGLVPVVSHEDTDQVHCGPGPFSMAGPDMVSAMLKGAGYDRIRFERYDGDICIGRDLAEAVEFAIALGPAGEIMRLAQGEGEKRKPQVVAALRETLSRYARDGGLWAQSSTWFVTARNP